MTAARATCVVTSGLGAALSIGLMPYVHRSSDLSWGSLLAFGIWMLVPFLVVTVLSRRWASIGGAQGLLTVGAVIAAFPAPFVLYEAAFAHQPSTGTRVFFLPVCQLVIVGVSSLAARTTTGGAAAPPVQLDSGMVVVGFWKRVAAALIDTAVVFAFMPVTMPLYRLCFEKRTVLPETALQAAFTFGFLYMIIRFGATPGKLVVGARIVDISGSFLPWSRALIRRSVELASLLVGTLELHRAVTSAPDVLSVQSFVDLGKALKQYGGHAYQLLHHVFLAFFVIDILVVLTNPRRRAIHDFMAGSYVVTKDSWMRHTKRDSSISSRRMA